MHPSSLLSALLPLLPLTTLAMPAPLAARAAMVQATSVHPHETHTELTQVPHRMGSQIHTTSVKSMHPSHPMYAERPRASSPNVAWAKAPHQVIKDAEGGHHVYVAPAAPGRASKSVESSLHNNHRDWSPTTVHYDADTHKVEHGASMSPHGADERFYVTPLRAGQ